MCPNEEPWAQIEKECLAIVAACDKWDLWIYGQQVNVHTDHQPLKTIFKKPLHAAPRGLQKMMMRLQRYNINVTYKKGTSLLLADTLSRAPLPPAMTPSKPTSRSSELTLTTTQKNHGSSLKHLMISRSPQQMILLCALDNIIIHGWPTQKSKLPQSLHPFWSYRVEFTTHDGIIYNGKQVVIPLAKRNYMLQKAYVAHSGPESIIHV